MYASAHLHVTAAHVVIVLLAVEAVLKQVVGGEGLVLVAGEERLDHSRAVEAEALELYAKGEQSVGAGEGTKSYAIDGLLLLRGHLDVLRTRATATSARAAHAAQAGDRSTAEM